MKATKIVVGNNFDSIILCSGSWSSEPPRRSGALEEYLVEEGFFVWILGSNRRDGAIVQHTKQTELIEKISRDVCGEYWSVSS